jgi:hypothetical protein
VNDPNPHLDDGSVRLLDYILGAVILASLAVIGAGVAAAVAWLPPLI